MMTGSFERFQQTEGAYELLSSRVSGLEELLRDAGIRVAGGGRLSEYRRLLSSIRTAIDGSPPKAIHAVHPVTLHQALLDCDQLLLIIAELVREPAIPDWQEKVQRLLLDSVMPGKKAHTPGRDNQFELYTLALLRRAGYQVESTEPDIVVHLSGLPNRIAVAAKRVKSRKKLREKVRGASDQVARSGMKGIIALGVNLLVNQEAEPLLVEGFETARTATRQVMTRFTQEHAVEIRGLVDLSSVFGLLSCYSGFFFFNTKEKPAVVTHWKAINLCQHDDPLAGLLGELVDRVGRSAVYEQHNPAA